MAEARKEQRADVKLIQVITAEREKQTEQFLRMNECDHALTREQAEERLEHQIKTGALSEEMQARLWDHVEKLARAARLHHQGDASADQFGPRPPDALGDE